MNYNVTVNGKVYSVTVEKTGAAAPAAVAAPVAAAHSCQYTTPFLLWTIQYSFTCLHFFTLRGLFRGKLANWQSVSRSSMVY